MKTLYPSRSSIRCRCWICVRPKSRLPFPLYHCERLFGHNSYENLILEAVSILNFLLGSFRESVAFYIQEISNIGHNGIDKMSLWKWHFRSKNRRQRSEYIAVIVFIKLDQYVRFQMVVGQLKEKNIVFVKFSVQNCEWIIF